MRILQICPAFYPAISIGGPIFTILSLQSVLVSKGHTIDVLSTPLGLSSDNRRSIKYNKPLPIPTPPNYPHSHNSGNIVYQRFWGYPHFTFSPMTVVWLFKNVIKYDLVILHGVWNFPFIASSLACRIFEISYIIFPHGTIYKETIELRSRKKKLLMLKLFCNSMLKAATRVVFTTIDEQNKVQNYLGKEFRSFVMPNVVPSNIFDTLPMRGGFRKKFGIAEDSLVLTHYGRISKKKGLEFTIRALSVLRSEFPNLVLLVVGGDDEGHRAEIQSQAEAAKVSDMVIFTGIVNQEEGKAALIDSDVFVLPSLSENFGMAVVEAMLCRVPVVISNNVGISAEINAACAGIVIELSEDNQPLVNGIARLLCDPEGRRLLGLRGREFASNNYDVPAVSARIDDLLNEVKVL